MISEVGVLLEQITAEQDAIRDKMTYLKTTPKNPRDDVRIAELMGKIDGLELAKVLISDNRDYATEVH